MSKTCGPARVLMWDARAIEREGVLPVEAMLVQAGLLRGMTVCCQILVGSFVLAPWGSSRLRGNRVQSGRRLGAHIAKVHWCTCQAKGLFLAMTALLMRLRCADLTAAVVLVCWWRWWRWWSVILSGDSCWSLGEGVDRERWNWFSGRLRKEENRKERSGPV